MSPDRHRPRFHFSPDMWMNDPIPFYNNGMYHIFYQHNPGNAVWGDMNWGHCVSKDLVRWEQLPIALAPTRGEGPDEWGVWTGCVVEHRGTFYAFYTGIPKHDKPLRQVQCLATSTDLITWTKHPGNPIISEKPAGVGECFRDPQVWREGDTWLMAIGSELPEGKGGVALLYSSDDLIHWQYLHQLAVGDTRKTGHDYECPDFFPLGENTHVLLTSRNNTYWHTGQYNPGRTFTPIKTGLCDGSAFYAAKTLLDDGGRRILFGWIKQDRPEEQDIAAGWAGVLSLPRVLTVMPDGTLAQEPVHELRDLRHGDSMKFDSVELKSGQVIALPGVMSDSCEVHLEIDPDGASHITVGVRRTMDGAESTDIVYDRAAEKLNDVPLHLAPAEPLRLQVFIDRSVIEVFANGRACKTLRTYPDREDALGIALTATGSNARLRSARIWNLG